MTRLNSRLVWNALLAPMLFCWQMAVANPAFANPAEGVNASDLAWSPPATRSATLQHIAQSGFKSVRLALLPPFASSIATMQEAQDAGLTVLLDINLSYAQFNPPGAALRSGENKLHAAHSLSSLDPAYFRQVFTPIWDQIEAHHLKLAAIEVGNEINWADYNGDLGVKAAPDARAISSLTQLPERDAFIKGLKNYLATVAVIHDLREKSATNKSMKILTAGLAYVPDTADIRKYAHYVSPQETVGQLRALGADNLVDAYGLHFYPSLSPDPAKQTQSIGATLGFCSPAKPCWLTEWGASDKSTNCADPDTQRVAAVKAFTQALGGFVKTHPIAIAYYFDFSNTQMPFSIWRCNKLTPAGQAVIQSQ